MTIVYKSSLLIMSSLSLGAKGRLDYIAFSAGGNPLPNPSRRRQPMEAMMNDQIFDREYQAGRAALNDGIGRIFASAGKSLQVLHAIHFDAPWKHNTSGNAGRSKAA